MNVPIQVQDLVSHIAHAHPSAELEYSPMPSGVCMMWVSLNGRDFVIDYHPKEGTGVSENTPDTPAFVGHDEVFESLDAAVARFKSLLADAELRGDPARVSTDFVMHDKPISQ